MAANICLAQPAFSIVIFRAGENIRQRSTIILNNSKSQILKFETKMILLYSKTISSHIRYELFKKLLLMFRYFDIVRDVRQNKGSILKASVEYIREVDELTWIVYLGLL